MTGLGSELTAKRLELLKEAVPRITRVAFLVNPADPPTYLTLMETAAKALKLALQQYEARGPGDLDGTIAAIAQERGEAMVVQGDTMFTVNAKSVADLALKHRLPSAGIPEYIRTMRTADPFFAQSPGPAGISLTYAVTRLR